MEFGTSKPKTGCIVLVAASALASFALVAWPTERRARSPNAGVVVVTSGPTPAVTPKQHANLMRSPEAPRRMIETPIDIIARTSADVALLATRFAVAPADSEAGSRAQRLALQIRQITTDGLRFAGLQVNCRRKMCEISGRVEKDGSAADPTKAISLLQSTEVVTAGKAEGLEPGSRAVIRVDTGETIFIAYLVAP